MGGCVTDALSLKRLSCVETFLILVLAVLLALVIATDGETEEMIDVMDVVVFVVKGTLLDLDTMANADEDDADVGNG